ncbi:MAG: crossover junction endodeoxyribonuclease RuvC [Gammaproteobacteria bacterium]|nr:crossover junction endodeoxyribonuclease RuvC [Gammaproteobacteria bacterium]
MSLILGIDPGSRCTGFGLIEYQRGQPRYVGSGCIRTCGDDFPQRLQQIFEGISEIVNEYKPDEAAIEQVFLGKNPNSAFKLGQARGVAIVAASSRSVPVSEYSARQVKQAVVGKGGAEKSQVQHMVCRLLKLESSPPEDAADGLAIALCHAHMNQGMAALLGAQDFRRGRVR